MPRISGNKRLDLSHDVLDKGVHRLRTYLSEKLHMLMTLNAEAEEDVPLLPMEWEPRNSTVQFKERLTIPSCRSVRINIADRFYSAIEFLDMKFKPP
jgi:hypothetical protein